MSSGDIAGYDYNADTYCRECIVKVLPTGPDGAYDGWADATGLMGAEEFLQGIADAFGINREDERSFDSGDFPKVILEVMIEEPETCGNCGAEIS